MSTRPRILCLSLSPIHRDARVLRQLEVLAAVGDVTTVGYGPRPDLATEHLEIPQNLTSLPQTPRGVALLAARRFRAAELAAPAVAEAQRRLQGHRFDLVVANEARILALAFDVAHGAPVWADMHEWAPEERTQVLSWRLLVAPFMTHLCATYLPRAAAVTTVGGAIAELYRDRFGVEAQVMRNSSPWRDLHPSPTDGSPIRLVHSGGAEPSRNIETIIDVVRELGPGFTLDLLLVPAADGGRYLGTLKERAKGCDRITFRDPVRPHELPDALNVYDVGVHWIPPTQTNARLALPNKFFDYVQARLAVAIGPSVEMATLVDKYGLGFVSESFEPADCAASLRALDAESVRAAKAASDAASRELSFEADAAVGAGIIERLLGPRGASPGL